MLKKIREKPHHVKRNIAFSISLLISSSILFVWVSSGDARSRESEIREKTVSPIDGVAAMFSGFTSGMRERISGKSSSQEKSQAPRDPNSFDLSRVVILDPTATSSRETLSASATTKSVATSTKSSTTTVKSGASSTKAKK